MQSHSSESDVSGTVDLRRLVPDNNRSYSYVSGLQRAADLVVRTRHEWDRLWPRICNPCQGNPGPSVDFTRQIVIVAAMGRRNSGGYSILIEGARRINQHLEIVIREEIPGPSCAVTLATSQPVDIAILARTSERVVFRHYSTETDCS
jgi:hypothetical protein